jgi:glycerol-3-phosphate dehydrogenase
VTRDYVLTLTAEAGTAPLLSVFGGKLTTYRKLAERALAKLAPFFPGLGSAWTASAALPGGDLPEADLPRFGRHLRHTYARLPQALLCRYARCYGSRAMHLLDGVREVTDLGQHFGALLYEREVDYLRRCEWAVSAADILWRRTKHGLHLTPPDMTAFAAWLDRQKA